jgi:hypothetical protein
MAIEAAIAGIRVANSQNSNAETAIRIGTLKLRRAPAVMNDAHLGASNTPTPTIK